jgi:hypothetical protein
VNDVHHQEGKVYGAYETASYNSRRAGAYVALPCVHGAVYAILHIITSQYTATEMYIIGGTVPSFHCENTTNNM